MTISPFFLLCSEEAMRDGVDEEGQSFAPVVVTRRLFLRPRENRDHDSIGALARNPRVAENLFAAAGGVPGGPGESFVVIERHSCTVIGATGYGPMADRPAVFEIATWVGEPHWGAGYATEATQALIDRAFLDPRIEVLWCANRAMNDRARRVIEKCGFQFRERGMVRSPAHRGAVPVERFVLERRNWMSLKAWGAHQLAEEPRDAPRDNAA